MAPPLCAMPSYFKTSRSVRPVSCCMCHLSDDPCRAFAVMGRRQSAKRSAVFSAEVVRPAGIEPATLGLEVRCSVQLSYGRTANIGTDDSIALADRGRPQDGSGSRRSGPPGVPCIHGRYSRGARDDTAATGHLAGAHHTIAPAPALGGGAPRQERSCHRGVAAPDRPHGAAACGYTSGHGVRRNDAATEGCMTTNTDAGVWYLFIVARRNPDILARVQERLYGDPRIDVLADRRYGERRRSMAPHAPERRCGDRRRPTNVWNDLTIYPTLVAQRHVDSYADLERKAAAAAGDNELLREYVADLERRIDGLIAGEEQLRAENTRLREETAELQRRLAALAAADAEFKADVTALLAQAEQALGGLIANFRRLTPEGRQPQKEPRLRSV